jgi:hypothetical protein
VIGLNRESVHRHRRKTPEPLYLGEKSVNEILAQALTWQLGNQVSHESDAVLTWHFSGAGETAEVTKADVHPAMMLVQMSANSRLANSMQPDKKDT